MALNDVSLTVYPGEIRGLIGENGSGKSTVTSIVAGMQECDSGAMTFQGQSWKPLSMIDALHKGIGMIVQESGTIPGITVAENIFLAESEKYKNKFGLINRKKMNADATRVMKNIGVNDVTGEMLMQKLDFQTRKLVEIAKVVMKEPQILVIDETSTALSHDGREILYDIMNEKMFSQENDTERTINKKDNKAKNEVLTYVRDYRVMTNLKYRLITNILIPLLAIFTSMLISCSKTVWAWIGVIVIVYDFYMMCEVVQDYFCFGCMCKKNAFGMHFLKTGFNGVRYFQNAVLVDILVRPIRIGITILIASIPFIKFGVNIWSIFDIIMISSIVSVGSLNIFRYMDLGMYIYLLALIVIFPAIAGSIAVLIYGAKIWFIAPVLAVVLVGVIAATYYHMMVRIRRSYVDV